MNLLAGLIATALFATPMSGGATIDDGTDTLLATASQTTHGAATGGGAHRSLIRYEWIDAAAGDGLGNGTLCNATGGTDLTAAAGAIRLLQAFDRATGALLGEPERRCVALTPGADALPSPPTAGDVWSRARLPAPLIYATPPVRGVTGFATHLWSTPPAPVTVSVSLPPYSVRAAARPVAYTFDWGDGTRTSSLSTGDREHPAARHVYERKGEYRITVSTVWSASATFSGPGFSPVPVNIGNATTSTTAIYPVDEIRSVLVMP